MHDEHWTEFCDVRALSPSSVGIERVVVDGMRVAVVGTTVWRQVAPGRESGFREMATEVCLVGDFDHPVVVIAVDVVGA
jgi:hypothetical protein